MQDQPRQPEASIQEAAAEEVRAIIHEAIFEKHLLVTGLYLWLRRKHLIALATEAKAAPEQDGARISPFSYSIF